MFFFSCKSFSSDSWYDAHFYGIREEGVSPPHQHHSFENRWRNIDILCIILKGILSRFRFNSNFWNFFDFLTLWAIFAKWLPNSSRMAVWKNSYEWIYYIGVKHVIWRFRICYYFCEIFQFLDFMNTLRNFAKSVLLVFSREKIYINGIFRSHALKWCIIWSHLKFEFFRIPLPELLGSHFWENLFIKSRNQNISEKY